MQPAPPDLAVARQRYVSRNLRRSFRGLVLVDRMDALRRLLGDKDLSAVLRRPLAEERAQVEQELEALLMVLAELRRAESSQRDDLLQRLAARLEVDRAVPAGLLAPG